MWSTSLLLTPVSDCEVAQFLQHLSLQTQGNQPILQLKSNENIDLQPLLLACVASDCIPPRFCFVKEVYGGEAIIVLKFHVGT